MEVIDVIPTSPSESIVVVLVNCLVITLWNSPKYQLMWPTNLMISEVV